MHVKDYPVNYTKDDVIQLAQERLGHMWEMKNGGPQDLYFVRKGFSGEIMMDKWAPEKSLMAVKYVRLNFSRSGRVRVTFGTNMWAWFLYFFGTAALASFWYRDPAKNFGAYFILGYIFVAYLVSVNAIKKVVDRVLY